MSRLTPGCVEINEGRLNAMRNEITRLTAELKELAIWRDAAINEAEAREVSASLAINRLETDNAALRAERDAWKDEVRAVRAERDEAQAKLETARKNFIKALKDRPTAPHPADQLNNLAKNMWEDAEAECESLHIQVARLEGQLATARLYQWVR